jgi:hypothetical protein
MSRSTSCYSGVKVETLFFFNSEEGRYVPPKRWYPRKIKCHNTEVYNMKIIIPAVFIVLSFIPCTKSLSPRIALLVKRLSYL